MVLVRPGQLDPMKLVVTGEAEEWLGALGRIVPDRWLHPRRVRNDHELIEVVRTGNADAAVLDEDSGWDIDVLKLLRVIRRLDARLPVVIITSHTDRRWLEDALRLTAFSVVVRPLEFETLLRQIHQIMKRLHRILRTPQEE